MIQFETGTPTGRRILAGIQWSPTEEIHYEILHWYPCKGLKYPEGYYDEGGENVPNGAIKQFAEF